MGGYGESALVKKLTTYSKMNDLTTGKQCVTGPAGGGQMTSDLVRVGAGGVNPNQGLNSIQLTNQGTPLSRNDEALVKLTS